jgi:hypothetical protein
LTLHKLTIGNGYNFLDPGHALLQLACNPPDAFARAGEAAFREVGSAREDVQRNFTTHATFQAVQGLEAKRREVEQLLAEARRKEHDAARAVQAALANLGDPRSHEKAAAAAADDARVFSSRLETIRGLIDRARREAAMELSNAMHRREKELEEQARAALAAITRQVLTALKPELLLELHALTQRVACLADPATRREVLSTEVFALPE